MDYNIIGQTVPVVEMTLNKGESVYTQSGGMAYQTDGIDMNTNARGGVMKSLGRMFAGESIFMANYTANKDGAKVAFASTVPGSVIPIDLSQNPNGFILQKATGNGKVFLEVDGDAIEKELAPGEVLKVDTGNVVAFEPSVSYEIERIKGLGNIFLGGEGLFLTKLVGPGRIILQSQNIQDFAGRLVPYMPTKSN